MADAIPAAPVTTAVTTTSGGGPVAVTTSADAVALQIVEKLADGAVLEGTAATRAVKGAVEITTADGTLQIKAQPGMTLPAFPPGAKLTLQMVGTGANGQLFLVAVNGRPLAGLGTFTPTPTPPIPGVTLPLPPGPGVSSPQPQGQGSTLAAAAPFGVVPSSAAPPTMPLGLSATVIRPAQAAGETVQTDHKPPAVVAGLPPDLPMGTRLTVRIAGVVLPDGGGEGLGNLPAMPPGSVSPGNPATSINPAAPGPRPAQPGQMPQGGMAPQITIPDPTQTAARLLSGDVIAHPPGGQAVVQTPVGTLAVPAHADLPAGTKLTLEVVGQPLPPLPPATPPATTAATSLGAQGWPVLSQALDVLANANQPQALEQLLRVMPQPDARLAATMAAFGGALRSGDIRSLLPDGSVRGLEKAGRKDVVARLKADLEGLAEEAGRPLGNGDWRLYTMPMLGGGAIEPVRLYVRKGSGDESGANKGAGNHAGDHRFVVDLNLTQLGRLQLDGLVRRQDKLFDLIIRTDAPLDQEIRRDILGIFTNASELVGTKGSVSFQAGGRWMEFPPAPPSPTRIEV